MYMWKSKGCPRCGGDIFTDRDLDGWYEQCLQCGYLQYMDSIFEMQQEPIKAQKERIKLKIKSADSSWRPSSPDSTLHIGERCQPVC